MKEKIDLIILNKFGEDVLQMLQSSTFSDCISSLDFISLLVIIEKETNIIFEDEYLNMDKLTNLEELYDYVKLSQREGEK